MISKLKEILALIELGKKKESGKDWISLGNLNRTEVSRYKNDTGTDLRVTKGFSLFRK
jgi:hypothetical protein